LVSGFPTNGSYTFLFSSIPATAKHINFDLNIKIIFSGEYKL
jgi:hypothetical protein